MLALASELRHLYQVSFACPPSYVGQVLLRRARGLGCVALPVDVATDSSAEGRLHKWFREKQIDILHSHAGISWEGQQVVRIARTAGVPAVVRTEHLPYLVTDCQQELEHRETIDLVDRLICVSDEARRSFVRKGFPREKLVTVRNGITVFGFRNTDQKLHKPLRLASHRKIVLTVARFTEQKGHKHLLQALPRVLAIQSSVHFVWAGTGPLAIALQKTARDEGLEQHISFLGNRDDVRELMASADVFVLPSQFEGLPLVLLEAMAVGVPIIGSRVCGIREVIRDGICGRLVPPADPNALATAILEVLSNPEKAAQWVLRARERVKRTFTVERMARETIAIYRQLLPSLPTATKALHEMFA